ncbi:phosphoribosyltransferase-like protein [Penicillium atrosanguineum]|uniref:Topoisomerase 1-associated factor 1 n=1 Tax=Penicillium atrosanguineum TaxID=1132637 RepID=A0A9W9PWU9_9EURO|nr:phosphoribosyltransferase-like protein [Penicillium atrosanguineum]KAJ5128485.1 Timeless protein [Penicillium atrosanguineum]KAJ5300606.1 phosphoribosyltransferase-like protein [Penicillium atrosanguineum]KAJ5311248.1 Timeless protein [Penicillium atrosanguineum]
MEQEVVALGHDVQVVDPDVRGYVYSLVTALGGFNGEDADKYMLGDDALACLRDIKRWLKLYDEKNNRMDVARCLGESNLVNGDLLPILSVWWNSGQKSKHMTRVALACLELLVPLTWPVEFHSQMTVNHHRHTPYIQQVQVQYKRGVLKYGGSNLLRAAIRIALPSMAMPRSERESRDEGILKLMLYFLRNIAIISTSARLAAEGEEEETSRSATINAFQEQDAFALILTMCSNVGDDFSMQDVVLLEILFHLVKGVNVEKLFMEEDQRKAKRTDELGDLLQKENLVRREYAKNAPTRHGRFGTMIWVKRDDAGKVSTVSGQDTLRNDQTTLQKMDQSKKWNKPRPQRRKEDVVQNNNFNMPTHLSTPASKNLRTFVEEFLDSGFNPLFAHLRKAIEREAERVLEINARQFFYTIGWFLEAERARRTQRAKKHAENGKSAKDIELDSYGLVAGVLNQETFISLNRSMQNSFDNKEWEDLTAQMRCFTQILLTVQEMTASPIEEDQEIAENIQNRIFYEETTHDRIIAIIRGYKDQGFGYLDAATELVHVFLRLLERYSKENADMQVRSRRKAKQKKKAEQDAGQGRNDDEAQNSEDEDLEDAAQVTKERSFDFKRFAAKFCNQSCVDTFVTFTSYYKELNTEQLKRAHRYFYRIAFKQEMTVLLFRLDIINLFHRMIKGPGAMDSSKSVFREWEELVRQILRRLTKKIEQRPALITELLFSKMNSTVFYLEYGHEKQTISTSKRPPAELQFITKEEATPEAKVGIVVGALVLDGRADLAKWVVDVLNSAASEREDWEISEAARRAEKEKENPDEEFYSAPNPMIPVKPCDDSCKSAMFSNAKLRLLMGLVGFERVGMEDVPGATWFVPAPLSSKDLRETMSSVNRSLLNPVPEGGEDDPRQLLRKRETSSGRQSLAQTTLDANFGSDSEGEDIPDGPLFPPNPRSKANALDELKKKRKTKKSKGDAETEPLDDETLEERREARLSNALARQAKIKSDLFIHASDEESDAEADVEFFRLEEERRKKQAENVKKALLTGTMEQVKSKKKGKRKSGAGTSTAESKRQRRGSGSSSDVASDADGDILMAELDAQSLGSPQEPSISRDAQEDTPITSAADDMDFDDDLVFSRDRQAKAAEEADADEEDTPMVPSRRRMRGGFVIESDSE